MSITEERVANCLSDKKSADILEYFRRKRSWYYLLSVWTGKVDIVSLTEEDRQRAIALFTREYDEAVLKLSAEADEIRAYLSDGQDNKPMGVHPTIVNYHNTKPTKKPLDIPVVNKLSHEEREALYAEREAEIKRRKELGYPVPTVSSPIWKNKLDEIYEPPF